jgi:hypothetical protein
MRLTLLLAAAAALCGTVPLHAADALTAGIWEVTVTVESFDGSAVTPQMKQALASQKPQIMKQCLTAAQLQPTPDQLAIQSNGKCKSTSFAMANGKLASSAACTGTAAGMTMKSTTSGNYTPTSYAFRSSNIVTSQQGTVTTKTLMSGKWISACPK